MPEIKHNFTGGKMNKDLDERLVPKGEYRDAMNVQVSTSEGSDVGTVQNILGNIQGCTYAQGEHNPIMPNSKTVGSVSDEKNDTLYWLVAGQNLLNGSVCNLTSGDLPIVAKDMIMRKRKSGGGCEPVFVDKYALLTENQTTGNNNLLELPSGTSPVSFAPGMTVTGITQDNGTCVSSNPFTILSVGPLVELQVNWYYNTVNIPIPGGINTPDGIWTGGVDNNIPAMPGYFEAATGGSIGDYEGITGNIFINPENMMPGVNVGDYITAQTNNQSDGGLDIIDQNWLGNPSTENPTGVQITGINLVTVNMLPCSGSGEYQDMVAIQINGGPDSINDGPLQPYETACPNANSLNRYQPPGTDTVFNFWTLNPTGSVNSLTNTITIPPNDSSLDEIYDIVVTQGEQLSIVPYQAFPNGGCVDPNSLTDTSDYTLDIVSCDDMTTPIVPTINQNNFTIGELSFTIPNPNTILPVIVLDGNMDFDNTDYLYFERERVLNYDVNKPITGLNILDDMLLWVDGVKNEGLLQPDNGTEPKKINIPRSVAGTHITGDVHTYLINSALDIGPPDGMGFPVFYNNQIPIREEHITVIKKGPKNILNLDLDTGRDPNLNYSGIVRISDGTLDDDIIDPSGLFDFSNIQEFIQQEKTIKIAIRSDLDGNEDFELNWGNYKGKTVVLKEFKNDTAPSVPIVDYRIKGIITDWHNFQNPELISDTGLQDPSYPDGDSTGIIEIEILPTAIQDGFAPIAPSGETLDYAIDLFDEEEKLFEFKFPRFSYRYKYEDGEYSPFGPFTQVAFASGSFLYHTQRGFNLGMTNLLKEVKVKNFIDATTPKDVVEIEILYKEDISPNVYIVDSLKPTDSPTIQNGGSTFNAWAANEYVIDSDTIQAALPANQLLRPWDNVPRKALAQEVTANRVIYGNYLQNYNLTKDGETFFPNFKKFVSSFGVSGGQGVRSVKSLREYQIGVVFVDKYGRETPVLTSPTGTLELTKKDSYKSNRIRVALGGEKYPNNMEYFKFFIKETSGEYYNLAMDRFYNAEDSNIWLAFPSTDRNKIDEDSFLILKKGQESTEEIKEQARYKVLAIENEAPDFIKTNKIKIDSATNVPDNSFTNNKVFTDNFTECPQEGQSDFRLRWERFQNRTAAKMDQITDGVLYVEFGSTTSSSLSKRYRVTEISTDEAPQTAADPVHFNISIDGQFGDDVDFMSLTGDTIADDVTINIYKYVVENRPQFDGRFFVKIYNDGTFKKYIIPASTGDLDYNVTASRQLWGMKTTFYPSHAANVSQNFPYFFNPMMNMDPFFPFGDPGVAQLGGFGTWFGNNLYQQLGYSLAAPQTPGSENGLDSASEGSFWFIDAGPKVGSRSNNTLDMDSINNQTDNGLGLVQQSTSSAMEISFGPISHNYVGKLDYQTTHTDIAEFFDIGGDSGYYPKEKEFVEKLYPSNQFRWKEDPKQTVYTIQPGVNETQKLRAQADWLAFEGEAFSSPQNFTKGFIIDVIPKMTFDPFNDAGAGIIEEGSKIDVKSIDGGSGTIVSNTTPTNTALKECAIFVETIDGTDYGAPVANGVTPKGRIKEGMVLTHFDGTDGTPGTPISSLVNNTSGDTPMIRKIEELSGGGYKLFLQGTKQPLVTGTVDFVPTATEFYRFEQPIMNGFSKYSVETNTEGSDSVGLGNALDNLGYQGDVFYTMEFVEPIYPTEILPSDPAVWETEPKDSTDLDIYYEASAANPTILNSSTIDIVLPIGSTLNIASKPLALQNNAFLEFNNIKTILSNTSQEGNIITLNGPFITESDYFDAGGGDTINGVEVGDILDVTRPDGSIISVEIENILNPDVLYGGGVATTLQIKKELYNSFYWLNWHNCFEFGNGVESNRIRDNFNLPFIANGVKASTTLSEQYKEEHRKTGLIYSGIYNSMSGVNNLNQFIQAEKITKDVNPVYGSIQKLHTRDTNLVTLCEDKCLKILANKDAIFNADGNTQLTATENVLGQTIPFVGEYGISTNPESFASESYRAYFSDKVRGAIIRLSADGITPISEHGMKDWFRDNLKLSNEVIGSYDDKKDEYNFTIRGENPYTVTFKEDVKGWSSFKSFIPENGISCANDYYTFKDGNLYKHHEETVDRNTFYPQDIGINNYPGTFTASSFNVILNEAPGSVKSFNTLNYEGTQSKIDELVSINSNNDLTYEQIYITDMANFDDNQYRNLKAKKGWYVTSIKTDQQQGGLNEFIKKEGKWFNYIKGKAVSYLASGHINDPVTLYDTKNRGIQGLGSLVSVSVTTLEGCTCDGVNMDSPCDDFYSAYGQSSAFNYDENANMPDPDLAYGGCAPVIEGCMETWADNYNDYDYDGESNISAGILIDINTQDNPSSCFHAGCTCNGDQPNFNNEIVDCTAFGSLGYTFYDSTVAANNYDPFATIDDGSCVGVIYGCTDPNAYNYDPNANTAATGASGSEEYNAVDNTAGCIPVIEGCMDAFAVNYWQYTVPIESINNLLIAVNTQDDPSSCLTGVPGCDDTTACNTTILDNPLTEVIIPNNSCVYCGDTGNNTYNYSNNYATPSNALTVVQNNDSSTVGTCSDPIFNNDIAGCDSVGGDFSPCTSGCLYCNSPLNLGVVTGSETSSSITIQWSPPEDFAVPNWGNYNAAPVSGYIVEYRYELFSGNWPGGDPEACVTNCGDWIEITPFDDTDLGNLTLDANGYVQYTVANIPEDLTAVGGSRLVEFRVRALCSGPGAIQSYSSGYDYSSAPSGYLGNTDTAFGSVLELAVPGCTDPLACVGSYNASANVDDGSCDYSCVGCTDSTFIEYWDYITANSGGNTLLPATINCDSTNVGVSGCIECSTNIVAGCTDSTAFNYDPNANAGCDGGPISFNPIADTSCCEAVVEGCSDNTSVLSAGYGGAGTGALNYNAAANTNDGSCEYTSPIGTGTVNGISGQTFNYNTPDVSGVTNPAVIEISISNGTIDSGSSGLVQDAGMPWGQLSSAGVFLSIPQDANGDQLGSGNNQGRRAYVMADVSWSMWVGDLLSVGGNTNLSATNNNLLYWMDQGATTWTVFFSISFTDPVILESNVYDSNQSVTSTIDLVRGCMDPSDTCSYDPAANVHDAAMCGVAEPGCNLSSPTTGGTALYVNFQNPIDCIDNSLCATCQPPDVSAISANVSIEQTPVPVLRSILGVGEAIQAANTINGINFAAQDLFGGAGGTTVPAVVGQARFRYRLTGSKVPTPQPAFSDWIYDNPVNSISFNQVANNTCAGSGVSGYSTPAAYSSTPIDMLFILGGEYAIGGNTFAAGSVSGLYDWPIPLEAQYAMPRITGTAPNYVSAYYDYTNTILPPGDGVEFEVQFKSVCKQTLNNDTCVDVSEWSSSVTFSV